ncbi:MAG: 3-dehydroquinate synthase [Bacteroidota bacterium]|nr:3-dehydroquinate synthase [Bacteroidota bacterium]
MEKILTDNYAIEFESGYESLIKIIDKNKYSKIFLLVDENTENFCLNIFKNKTTLNPNLIKIKSGEENKNIHTCIKIWNSLINSNADRKSLLINLGGGVITDIGGFSANTYNRGIDFVNIPTTLLSIVDASVGSKTGINQNGIKNKIGTFYDPKMVIIDTEYLKTLEQRQINSGYCEIFKHSLISKQNSKFEYLTDSNEINFSLDIIINSINIKNNFVSEDKYEKKRRKGLNFGHTIGHAIETHFMSSDKKLLHGEAIAIGIIIESFLSKEICGFDIEKVDKIKNHLLSIFNKIQFNSSSINNIIKMMEYDKKNTDKEVNFVLLSDIGKLIFDVKVPDSNILDAFEYYSK